MKICYIPAKDKVPMKTKMYSLGLLTATAIMDLAPRTKEVVEVIRDNNNVTTITTVYGTPRATGTTGTFGARELLIIAVVGVGAYWFRTNYQKDKEAIQTVPKKNKEVEFDMSIFDKTGGSEDDE